MRLGCIAQRGDQMKEMGWQVPTIDTTRRFGRVLHICRSYIEPVAVDCSKSACRFQNRAYLAESVRGVDSEVDISSTYLPPHHKPLH